jgi:hypothetical protein
LTKIKLSAQDASTVLSLICCLSFSEVTVPVEVIVPVDVTARLEVGA